MRLSSTLEDDDEEMQRRIQAIAVDSLHRSGGYRLVNAKGKKCAPLQRASVPACCDALTSGSRS